MKKILFLSAALAALTSCSEPQPTAKISGCLQGVENDSILIVYNSETGSESMFMDTIVLDHGKLAYNLPVEDEAGVIMLVDPMHFIDYISLYNLPGEHVVINGTFADYELSGSPYYCDQNEFRHLTADQNRRHHDLMLSIPQTDEDRADFDGAAYEKANRQIGHEIDSLAIAYIQANPDKDFSVYLTRELISDDYFAIAQQVLTERAKTGVMAAKYAEKCQLMKSEELRNASRKAISEGVEAPDFSLPTAEGETFTLSAQRGKWVLLDFWGTWCGWCVEGLPTVKEIAHTYADRLMVVSVDTGDSEKAWRAGIAKHGMDWTQVYNSREDALDSRYAVEGFPGFYLIDPEGTIVKMWFGEPAHFVELIGELIK